MYGDSGTLFTMANVRQIGNTASRASTEDLGCGSCRLQTGGAAATSIDNAPASSSVSGTTVPGVPSCAVQLLKWHARTTLCRTNSEARIWKNSTACGTVKHVQVSVLCHVRPLIRPAGLLRVVCPPSCTTAAKYGLVPCMSSGCPLLLIPMPVHLEEAHGLQFLHDAGVPAGGGGSGGLSGGAIAGIVIGVLGGLLLLGVLLWFLLRRRRARRGDAEMARGKGGMEMPVAVAQRKGGEHALPNQLLMHPRTVPVGKWSAPA